MSNNKVLTVVTQANGDGLKALVRKVEKFEVENEGVEVRVEQANGNFEVLDRIQRDEPGDLIHLSESVFAPYLQQGFIIDLMPLLEGDPKLSAEDFYRGAIEGPSVGGALAALPIDLHVPLIYYHKQSFQEAGIQEPTSDWSFETFLETAKRLTKEGRYGFKIGIDIEWFEPFVKRSGGAYVSPDGAAAKGYADSVATAEALQRIVDWFRVHHISPLPGEDHGSPFSGKFAMAFDFSWCIPILMNHHEGEFGVVGLPRTLEGEDTNMMYMGGYGISAACNNREEAWRLLKEIAVPETGHPLGLLPATKPIARRLGLEDHPYIRYALAELDKGTKSAFYVSQTWNANRQIIKQDLMEWITNGSDVKASLKKWAERIG